MNEGIITANAVLLSDAEIDLTPYGIERVEISSSEQYLQQSRASVLGVHFVPAHFDKLVHQLENFRKRRRKPQLVVLHQDLSTEQLLLIFNTLHPKSMHHLSDDLDLGAIFKESFAAHYEKEQERQLIALVNDKNEELKRLTISLEQKVQVRQNQLEESTQKNKEAERRLKVLRNALVHIYKASTVKELEHGITQALESEFELAGVQIRLPSQSNIPRKEEGLKFYKAALKSGPLDFGHIFFFKKGNQSFEKKEKRFLNQVADAATLARERNFQYHRSQELKTQWEATFDAISDPICLTDENYKILRVNAGFLKKTGTKRYTDHLGKKCYQSLFGRSTPCEGCHRGRIFQVRNPSQNNQSEVFDVYSNDLGDDRNPVYFQMYRDVTQDLNLQRQVIETAKMAELGTISSSIAHELNNPIGGMLNFVQLMKMDLEGDEDFYPDIIEIEKGIIKCKNIVKNLLGFARKSFHKDVTETNLVEVIEQAIKITELKTRSIGIEIQFENQSENGIFIDGRFNLLTHAVRNILQNSQESLIAKRRQDQSFRGKINIILSESPESVLIEISDNGDGLDDSIKSKIFDPLFTTKDPETNSGLGLTLALQIVKEHNGTIKVSTSKDKKLTFELFFFKSEGQSGLSEI